jgi:phospholipid/cholesterol/gamma-HCH transport system substrate-binding protein
MEEKINFSVVGVFVLVLSAGLIGGVLWFSSGKFYHTAFDIYLTYMKESVSGLNLNAPVLYRGVEVGRVQKIALAPGNVEQVQLTLAIERGTPVKMDTVSVLQTQGLTGLAFVELSGGGRDSPALQKQDGEEYPVIKAAPSLMMRLDTAITALLANLNRASENFNALMDEGNQRAVKNTLADIEVLSRTFAARSAAIDSSLTNAVHTMENTARLTSELARAGASVNSTLENARQFTNETLPEAHQLVMELRGLTGSLLHFSDQLEQNPSILLYGKPAAKRGPGE